MHSGRDAGPSFHVTIRSSVTAPGKQRKRTHGRNDEAHKLLNEIVTGCEGQAVRATKLLALDLLRRGERVLAQSLIQENKNLAESELAMQLAIGSGDEESAEELARKLFEDSPMAAQYLLMRALVAGEGTTVGEALTVAKRRYYLDHELNHFHAKTQVGTALYGLPMYRVRPPGGGVGAQAAAPPVAASGGETSRRVQTGTWVRERRAYDFDAAAREWTGGLGVDVVYDSVGRTTFDASMKLLRPRGLLCLYGQSSGVVPPFDLNRLSAMGSLFVTRPSLAHYTASRAELEERAGAVLGAIASGALRVRIGARFPLEQARAAHDALEGRRTTGKVLLLPRC